MGNKNSAEKDEKESNKIADAVREEDKKMYGEIDQYFYKFDFDKNKALNEMEFREAIKNYIKMHPEKEKSMTELINSLEVDKDNQISLDDFRKIMMVYSKDEISLETLIDVFKCFDKNMQGYIGANEIRHVFSKLGLNITMEEAKELVQEADSDGEK